MKIKVSKILLESALIFQAKKDIRYYINGICFKSDGRVCSTDGHRAFIGSNHEGKLKEDIILSITNAPVRNYEHAVIDVENGIVEYFNEHQSRIGVGLSCLIDGRFPDIDRVIPKEFSSCYKIGFNAGYLADFEKAAKLFNPRWEKIIFELSGSTTATTARLESPHGDHATIVVMPMCID